MGKFIAWAMSGALQPFLNFGLNVYKAKLDGTNSHEAKAVELAAREMELDAQEARLNNDTKARILGRWYAPENLFAYFIAFPYWFKAITIDNVIGSIWDEGWSTPALGGATAEIMMMVMVFWFGKRSITSVATILADAFGKK